REPGLHADMAEAELRIEKVEVKHPLRPGGEREPRSPVAVAELDGATGLLAAQDADQALAETAFADLLLHQVFLAVTPLEIDVRGAFPGGEGFGVADEKFGFFFREGREVFALDAEGMIDKAV